MKNLRPALELIKSTPFTRTVLLTGSHAEGRSTKMSDIDFFVQVAPGHIWLARLIVTIKLQRAGIRRTDYEIAGKICLNWFATYNAPAAQPGRHYKELWREDQPNQKKSFYEFLFSILTLLGLEKILKYIQTVRIERDPRTHVKGSQVRYSDRELGFHPPKERRPPEIR